VTVFAQAGELLTTLRDNGVAFTSVMLDIEGDDWDHYTPAENAAFLTALRGALEDAGAPNLVVYAGSSWAGWFGENYTRWADRPLVYAHYDNVPSFYDARDNVYGGWASPAGKQFWDGSAGEQLCGSGPLDWDWSPRRFW
jgi:hypothetical protein